MAIEAVELTTQPNSIRRNGTPNRTVPLLDLLRSLACALVVIGHLRNLFFQDYQDLVSRNLIVKVIYFMSGFGHQAVIIFFVMSGLLVGGKVIRDCKHGTWSWKKYMIDRFTRLLIVLWPALVLTFILDAFGKFIWGAAGVYGNAGIGANVLPKDLVLSSTMFVYLGNAFFLQGVVTTTAGTNTPLWSLSNEFWYYVSFPALFIMVSQKSSGTGKLVNMALLALGSWAIVTGKMGAGYLIWLMGVAASVVGVKNGRKPHTSKVYICVGVLLVFASLCISRVFPTTSYFDFAIGLATAILCNGILKLPSSQEQRPFGTKIVHSFSGFSYTLYLTHLPFLVFLRGSLEQRPRWQPTLGFLALGFLIFVLAVFWAFFVSRYTEQHTMVIRHLLSKKLQRNRHPPVQKIASE